MIPELVESVRFEKGPYYADVGNYGSAGSAHPEFFRTLPQSFLQVEGGTYGYCRLVFGASHPLGGDSLLVGGEPITTTVHGYILTTTTVQWPDDL
ncbi:hypothetical protein ACFQBQ_16600 [Granulicella cerasi]|uniref:Uncharacterized protein n=1 Tax=Granulicella cerasi TaxID=741063 RepID=A0ABW1ZCL3_9BACT|nr:hypothetical protein [Granulicella cerasi]